MTARRMTPRQRQLARHALGFADGVMRSFRNRYSCAPESADAEEWRSMKRRGLADGRSAKAMKASLDLYWLTPEGARLVLGPGESLDPEDFPQEAG